MGVGLVVRLFLISYLYRRLGRADFGVYQVCISVTAMTAFLRFGLGGSVLRLASECISAADWQRLSGVLSIVRTIAVVMGGIALVLAVAASVWALEVLGIPAENRAGAAVLIQLTGISAACQILGIPYLGMLRAAQRYYFANTILVGENLVRLGLVVVLFQWGMVGLRPLGIAVAIPAVLMVMLASFMMRRVLPQVRLSFRQFSRKRLREVFGFASWIALANVARVVHLQIVAPLISALIGIEAVPLVVVPRQIALQMVQAVSGFTQPARPIATNLAVTQQGHRLAIFYQMLLRFCGIMVVGLVVLLIVFGRPVIQYLTDARMAEESYTVFIVLVTLVGVWLLGMPGEELIMGVGSVRGITLFRGAMFALGVVLAVAAVWTGWGLIGLVAGLYGPLVLHALLYVSWRVRQETGVRVWRTLGYGVLPPVALGVAVGGLGAALKYAWYPPNIFWTIAEMGLLGVSYLLAAWALILTVDERRMIRSLLPGGRRGGMAATEDGDAE